MISPQLHTALGVVKTVGPAGLSQHMGKSKCHVLRNRSKFWAPKLPYIVDMKHLKYCLFVHTVDVLTFMFSQTVSLGLLMCPKK